MTDELKTLDEIKAMGESFMRDYNIRAAACVNVLAGIDDPEAFMQDVWEYFEGKSVQGNERDCILQMKIDEHLKGGDA